MKTKFSNNRELCHVWASQSQEFGKGNNLSFTNEKIQSYDWFTIGMFIEKDVVLVRTDYYSNSTSRHLHLVRSAIPNYYRVFYCYYLPDRNDKLTQTIHNKNISYYLAEIANCAASFKTSRVYKRHHYSRQIMNSSFLQQYCNLFGLDVPTYELLDNGYVDRECEKADKRTLELKEKAEEKYQLFLDSITERLQEHTTSWINGEHNSPTLIAYNGKKRVYISYPNIYLRVKNNEVETSKGAKVPLKEAHLLYKMIEAGKDIKGHQIGHYTVIGINGTLKIGCHDITREEIKRFANSQNW